MGLIEKLKSGEITLVAMVTSKCIPLSTAHSDFPYVRDSEAELELHRIISSVEKTSKEEGAVSPPDLPNLQHVLAQKYKLACAKNADYGDSVNKVFDKLLEHSMNPLLALYIRVSDKFNRFENLVFKSRQQVLDESIDDTLKDLSNYIDLYHAWKLKKKEG